MLGYEVVSGYFDQTIAKLKEFEGSVPWMYRDTVGKVTVGVGLMVPDAAAACALPFVMAAGPANLEQIGAEFARVEALPLGKAAAFYKAPMSPELPQSFLDEKLSLVLAEFEAVLRAKLPNYDKLPDVVKMVLLDMAYNLGPKGLLTDYPRMFDAIETGAWSQAAAQCERVGISVARNTWAKQQFLAAVVATIRAGVVAEMKAEAQSLKEETSKKSGGFWGKVRKALSGK